MFGDRLKKARIGKKLSQEELASKLFVSRQAVTKWEANKSEPSMAMIISIANILDVDLNWLIKGEQKDSLEKNKQNDESKEDLILLEEKIVNKDHQEEKSVENKNVVTCDKIKIQDLQNTNTKKRENKFEVIKIFIILGTILTPVSIGVSMIKVTPYFYIGLIYYLVTIPLGALTIKKLYAAKSKNDVIIYGILCMLFCSFIGGILILCLSDNSFNTNSNFQYFQVNNNDNLSTKELIANKKDELKIYYDNKNKKLYSNKELNKLTSTYCKSLNELSYANSKKEIEFVFNKSKKKIDSIPTIFKAKKKKKVITCSILSVCLLSIIIPCIAMLLIKISDNNYYQNCYDVAMSYINDYKSVYAEKISGLLNAIPKDFKNRETLVLAWYDAMYNAFIDDIKDIESWDYLHNTLEHVFYYLPAEYKNTKNLKSQCDKVSSIMLTIQDSGRQWQTDEMRQGYVQLAEFSKKNSQWGFKSYFKDIDFTRLILKSTWISNDYYFTHEEADVSSHISYNIPIDEDIAYKYFEYDYPENYSYIIFYLKNKSGTIKDKIIKFYDFSYSDTDIVVKGYIFYTKEEVSFKWQKI